MLLDLKLSKNICDRILDIAQVLSLTSYSSTEESTKDIADTIRSKGEVKDLRELKLLQGYLQYQESDYLNIDISRFVKNLISDDFFNSISIYKENCSIVVKKYKPGKVMTPHIDYYLGYMNKYNVKDNIKRFWITLTEPRFGHVLIIEDKVYYWLDQGSVITWNDYQLHTAANLGFEDRYIMTITGSQNVDRD